jgi:adenine C2-methylase RlmN of 23S rRNA A2503 and tRNA A37
MMRKITSRNDLNEISGLNLEGITANSLVVEGALLFRGTYLQTEMRTKDGYTFVNTYCPSFQGDKYILAVATQIGCKIRCKDICHVPQYRRSLSSNEISDQVKQLQRVVQLNKLDWYPDLKIVLVKEGEPLLNEHLSEILSQLGTDYFLPIKISTSFPHSTESLVENNINSLIDFARAYPPGVQLQISLGSTNMAYRERLTIHPTASFERISELGKDWNRLVNNNPSGCNKRISLSFTLYEETPCQREDIENLLPPENFAVRFRDALNDNAPNNMTHLSEKRFQELNSVFQHSPSYKVLDGRTTSIEKEFHITTGQYETKKTIENYFNIHK